MVPDALKLRPRDAMQDDPGDNEHEGQIKDDARQTQVHDITTRIPRDLSENGGMPSDSPPVAETPFDMATRRQPRQVLHSQWLKHWIVQGAGRFTCVALQTSGFDPGIQGATPPAPSDLAQWPPEADASVIFSSTWSRLKLAA